LLQQCNIVNLRALANCCVRNYTPVEKTRSANDTDMQFFRFLHVSSVFVRTKYTSNMASLQITYTNRMFAVDTSGTHLQ